MSASAVFSRSLLPGAISKLAKSTSEAPGREGRGGVVPVVAGRVGEAHDDLKFSGIGTARALAHVTLYPAVAGEVEEVRFAPGTWVETTNRCRDSAMV